MVRTQEEDSGHPVPDLLTLISDRSLWDCGLCKCYVALADRYTSLCTDH